MIGVQACRVRRLASLNDILARGRCRRHTPRQRSFSGFVVSQVVKDALAKRQPVVCLESTIITHGMSFPANLRMARDVEAVITQNGATPATIAILHGIIHIGLNNPQLEELARIGQSAQKVSRRDLAQIVADKGTGGTTVSATMILAKLAGIQVFVTGGIGGVHRFGESTMDISNDLNELSRNDVTVVCAGPKAILDIPRTLEYLETMGVTVSTLGQANLPAFYTRDSGIASPQTSMNPKHVAKIIKANQDLKLSTSVLVCVPIPAESSIDGNEMEKVIGAAIEDMNALAITGKNTTPHLLAAVSKATEGRSLTANIALVMENAKIGAQIACEYAKLLLESEPMVSTVFSERLSAKSSSVGNAIAQSLFDLEEGFSINAESPAIRSTQEKDLEVLVVGGVAYDITCTIDDTSMDSTRYLHTSNPGTIHSSIGGVGGNIARAARLSGSSVAFASIVGIPSSASDLNIQHFFENCGITTNFVETSQATTASYTCVQANKALLVGVADMKIFDSPELASTMVDGLHGKYQAVVIDGNLTTALGHHNLKKLAKMSEDIVCFEPTSVAKSTSVFYPGQTMLDVFTMTTPNIHELSQMFSYAKKTGVFETVEWWTAINSLNVNSDFRMKAEIFLRNSSVLKALNLGERGVVQQCLHLLPVFKNIYLTLGEAGVLSVHHTSSGVSAPLSETSGSSFDHEGPSGVVTVMHHPASVAQGMLNDTGCGDTFTGVLISCLTRKMTISTAVRMAQEAAILTLQCDASVSPDIATLMPKPSDALR